MGAVGESLVGAGIVGLVIFAGALVISLGKDVRRSRKLGEKIYACADVAYRQHLINTGQLTAEVAATMKFSEIPQRFYDVARAALTSA